MGASLARIEAGRIHAGPAWLGWNSCCNNKIGGCEAAVMECNGKSMAGADPASFATRLGARGRGNARGREVDSPRGRPGLGSHFV